MIKRKPKLHIHIIQPNHIRPAPPATEDELKHIRRRQRRELYPVPKPLPRIRREPLIRRIQQIRNRQAREAVPDVRLPRVRDRDGAVAEVARRVEPVVEADGVVDADAGGHRLSEAEGGVAVGGRVGRQGGGEGVLADVAAGVVGVAGETVGGVADDVGDGPGGEGAGLEAWVLEPVVVVLDGVAVDEDGGAVADSGGGDGGG